jgi:hypothetical protein
MVKYMGYRQAMSSGKDAVRVGGEWPDGDDGYGAYEVPFAVPKWFDVPCAGVKGKATVKVYDGSGLLDAKTCHFHLAP